MDKIIEQIKKEKDNFCTELDAIVKEMEDTDLRGLCENCNQWKSQEEWDKWQAFSEDENIDDLVFNHIDNLIFEYTTRLKYLLSKIKES